MYEGAIKIFQVILTMSWTKHGFLIFTFKEMGLSKLDIENKKSISGQITLFARGKADLEITSNQTDPVNIDQNI